MNNRFGSWGSCVINIWGGRVEAHHLHALGELTRTVASEHGGATMLVVIEQGVPIVSTEERKLVEDFYATIAPQLVSVAQCVEGGNLWAVTARSVLTAIRLVQRKPYALKVFSNVEASLQWLSNDTTPPADEGESDVGSGLQRYFDKLRFGHANP